MCGGIEGTSIHVRRDGGDDGGWVERRERGGEGETGPLSMCVFR